ncbi:MAG: hypothetical protein D6685_16005 [Bacteroidetes bacterium]|nr:MAG: hypothetical protein D6685_16005 [Bacteroidota bacterium]
MPAFILTLVGSLQTALCPSSECTLQVDAGWVPVEAWAHGMWAYDARKYGFDEPLGNSVEQVAWADSRSRAALWVSPDGRIGLTVEPIDRAWPSSMFADTHESIWLEKLKPGTAFYITDDFTTHRLW